MQQCAGNVFTPETYAGAPGDVRWEGSIVDTEMKPGYIVD